MRFSFYYVMEEYFIAVFIFTVMYFRVCNNHVCNVHYRKRTRHWSRPRRSPASTSTRRRDPGPTRASASSAGQARGALGARAAWGLAPGDHSARGPALWRGTRGPTGMLRAGDVRRHAVAPLWYSSIVMYGNFHLCFRFRNVPDNGRRTRSG